MQSKIYKHDRFDLIETIASHMYRSVIALLTPEERKKKLIHEKRCQSNKLLSVVCCYGFVFIIICFARLFVAVGY